MENEGEPVGRDTATVGHGDEMVGMRLSRAGVVAVVQAILASVR